jgi:hypothetical protein
VRAVALDLFAKEEANAPRARPDACHESTKEEVRP